MKETLIFQRFLPLKQEAQTGFEPVNQGVADPRLTAWLLRHTIIWQYIHILIHLCTNIFFNDSDGNRTRVTAVKGRCLNRLTTEPRIIRHSIFSYRKTPRVGLEPTTPRLTAACSTIELSRIIQRDMPSKPNTVSYRYPFFHHPLLHDG